MILFCEPERILPFKEALKNHIENLEKIIETDLYIPVSDRIDRYLGMSEAARQISRLSQIAGKLSVKQKVLWREELKYEENAAGNFQTSAGEELCERTIDILEEYDRQHGTDLMETLEVLLRNGGSKKQTAETLYLHRNTMMYRVKKMEEILKCNMGDFKTIQELAFTCLVREYLTENKEEGYKL